MPFIVVGLLAMYVPTYLGIYRFFWTTQQGSYGAVMFLLVCWLIWRERSVLDETCEGRSSRSGMAMVAVGLLIYIAGRSQTFYQLEVASQIPLLLGIVSLTLGPRALRRMVFPLSLLIFVVPIPGSLLDEFLLPLKRSVSDSVDNILYFAGYPIARNGVVLTIGRYNLMIADACSGLNSMIALSGVGLLYVCAIKRRERWLKVALLLGALPIAFIANLVRVGLLVLVTYYWGYGAGRTFHNQAGYLEIFLAFGAFLALDRMLTWSARLYASARQ